MATNKIIDPTNVTVQVPAMADKPNQATNSNCLDKLIDGINALNSKLSYSTVTDWNNFKPSDTSNRTTKYGSSTGGTASNSPFSGDDAAFYGYVEGYPTYCTQHLTVQYSTTTRNRNRTFIRSFLSDTWTEWVELLQGSGRGFIGAIDLDNVVVPGVYGLSSGTSYTHLPTGFDSGILEVVCPLISGYYAIQRLSIGNKFAMRYRTNSSGSAWTNWSIFTGT